MMFINIGFSQQRFHKERRTTEAQPRWNGSKALWAATRSRGLGTTALEREQWSARGAWPTEELWCSGVPSGDATSRLAAGEGTCGRRGSGPVSEERTHGWRRVRARSSASAWRVTNHWSSAARPPAPWA
jgi:hypothetical protein